MNARAADSAAAQAGAGRLGTLYLIPTGLGSGDTVPILPPATLAVLSGLHRFIVENPKSARRFLKSAGYPHPLSEASMQTLDEHTAAARLPELIAPILAGEDCGLVSEAGCPAVADPGADLVRLAHERGVRVAPLVGPSAVLLALMASGLNGQRFEFHGYLPIDAGQRARRLRELEDQAERTGATQIFIETPYRNDAVFQAVLDHCRDDTLLCVAVDLTLPSEAIATRTIAEWKKNRPPLNRRPAVFLLGCPDATPRK
ncbi:MAG TPA: SAM-dependent methyltransferase [Burkholderiales bacterium]|jgi:16S rRNA (cytidine1402-2'-O)-methyltransferase|nr:SAM-dependent methyltransferase [Burkholderiales bacterium]